MATDYILDLGDDGKIVIVSQETLPQEENDEDLLEKGFVTETVQRGTAVMVENATKLITFPLRGIVKLLLDSLPTVSSNDAYQLDEFTVEFEMGIESQIGKDGDLLTGAIAKIMPKGNFKCAYKWSRKSES